jgi:hypothetical protein
VISAANLVSFVECPLTFDPVKKIAHDGCTPLPTLESLLNLSVPIKVAVPAVVGRVSCDAHQLGSQVVYLNSIPTFTIGQLVQSMAIQFKDAVFETHTLTSGTNAARDQALTPEVAGVQDFRRQSLSGKTGLKDGVQMARTHVTPVP